MHFRQRLASLLEAPDDVLQGGAGEKILLPQAQLLASQRVVVGVQHVGDTLRLAAGLNGVDVVARVEAVQVKLLKKKKRREKRGGVKGNSDRDKRMG